MPRLPKHVEMRNGNWWYRRQVRGARRRWNLGPELAEARVLARQLAARIARGTLPAALAPTNEPTFREFSDQYLQERAGARSARDVREARVKLEKQRIRDHVWPTLGTIPIGQVRVADLFRLRTALDKKKLAPRTVHHALGTARSVLRYAERVEAAGRIPSFEDVMPRIPESEKRFLSDDEVRRLLLAAGGYRSPWTRVEGMAYRRTIELAVSTGRRLSEYQRLTWHQVHLEDPEPHLTLPRTKAGKVQRVPLFPEAVTVLKQLMEMRAGIYVLPWRGKNACGWVKRIGKAAGVEWTFHRLRHTFAHRCRRAGIPLAVIQSLLGHSTVRMTEAYATEDEGIAAEFVGRFGSLNRPRMARAGTSD